MPYAHFGNPQSLNLYAYVGNNPNTGIDLDGHDLGAPVDGNPTEGMHEDNQGAEANLGNTSTSTPPPTPPDDDKAQSQNQVNMDVKVSTQPGIMTNKDQGTTGIGGALQVTLTDSNGKPISGTVKESNKEGGTQQANSVPLKADGSFTDVIGKFGKTSAMPNGGSVQDFKDFVNTNPITVTSPQTLTINTGNASYQANWTRTLTNVGTNGTLNTSMNSNGVNFTLTWTTPVIQQTR